SALACVTYMLGCSDDAPEASNPTAPAPEANRERAAIAAPVAASCLASLAEDPCAAVAAQKVAELAERSPADARVDSNAEARENPRFANASLFCRFRWQTGRRMRMRMPGG